MLLLSRKLNESIIIGEGDDQVIVTVVESRGDKVRLGITAKTHIPVHREEIYEKIKNQEKE